MTAAGNKLTIWRKRTVKEVQKKLKRRRKRAEARGKSGDESLNVDLQPSDEWEAFVVHRAAVAVRSFAFIPGSKSKELLCALGVTLADNSIAVVHMKQVCSAPYF